MARVSTVQFNGSNAYELLQGDFITSFPFETVNFGNIALSVQVYSFATTGKVRVKVKGFDKTGKMIVNVYQDFTPTQNNIWQMLEATWEVPTEMVKGEVQLESITGTNLIAQPKAISGTSAGAYSTSYSQQLTFITQTGLYTGTITANQVILVDKENLSNRLVTINNALLSLQDRDDEISTDITAQGLTVTSNKQSISANTSRIDSLNSSLGTQILKLGEIDKKTGELGLSIETIKDDVSSNKSTLTAHNLTISSLGQRTVSNETEITSAKNLIEENTIQLGTLSRTSDEFGLQIEKNIGDISTNKSSLSSMNLTITSLGRRTDTTENKIQGLETSTAINFDQIRDAHTKLEATKKTVDSHTTSLSSFGAKITALETKDGVLSSSITSLTAGNLTLSTSTKGKIGSFTINSNYLISSSPDYEVRLSANSAYNAFQVSNKKNGEVNFIVAHNGHLYASSATITGDITAETGKIAGWLIFPDSLYKNAGSGRMFRLSGDSTKWNPITVSTSAGTQFTVDWNGKMTANNADIKGNIYAQSGTIGGFIIDSDKLYYKNGYGDEIRITGSGNYSPIQLYSGGAVQFSVDWKGKMFARNADITGKISAESGTIGGWNITKSFIDSVNGRARVYLASHADTANTFLGITDSNGVTQFSVSKQGHLTANSATIKGTLQAGSIINGQLNSTSGTHTGYTTGRHSGSLYNVGGTYKGGLVNTTGTHTGGTTGQHSGSLYSTSGNHAGSLTNTTGSHNGGVYSSAGSLGGSGYTVGTNGRLKFNSGIHVDGVTTINLGLRVYGNIVYSGTLSKDSDERLKQDIEDVPQNIVDELMNVKIKRFGYKTNPNEKHFGVIAQDLIRDTSRDISDTLVKPHEGYFTVAYEQFVPLLIKKVQDQEKRIKELEEKTV